MCCLKDLTELQKERQCLEKQHQQEVNKLNQELQQARALHNALQAQTDKVNAQNLKKCACSSQDLKPLHQICISSRNQIFSILSVFIFAHISALFFQQFPVYLSCFVCVYPLSLETCIICTEGQTKPISLFLPRLRLDIVFSRSLLLSVFLFSSLSTLFHPPLLFLLVSPQWKS